MSYCDHQGEISVLKKKKKRAAEATKHSYFPKEFKQIQHWVLTTYMDDSYNLANNTRKEVGITIHHRESALTLLHNWFLMSTLSQKGRDER